MRCSGILKAVSVMTVLLIGALMPRAAEAQARGSLQATATVVDTRTSFASLEVAREAVRSVVVPGAAQVAVSTVAQVTVQRADERAAALVVTIDYSRN
jgi:hypothetical protein